ncbi:flavodoxin domain-containing protein [Nocardioides sp.]|uniref:flavodoxin domain-containing protein n=1 Tax=Nocardioides sp. TaxID=35761 RepID=UPI002601269E|nr:flavodoxin domain-containing protein [Nocardioides sp.]
MSVLVAYASRYGATRQIAQHIAAVLTVAGLDVRVRPTTVVDDVRGHEAVILGSSVYRGHWMEQATAFVDLHHDALVERPTWLFSSGLLGPDQPHSDLDRLAEELGARDRQAFGGALEVGRLDLIDRVLRLKPARRRVLPPGDYRDWDSIEGWAHRIATELAPSVTPGFTPGLTPGA